MDTVRDSNGDKKEFGNGDGLRLVRKELVAVKGAESDQTERDLLYHSADNPKKHKRRETLSCEDHQIPW